jgi:hypothetical protein
VDALALVVAALGGGVVATILNEWLRGRREYEEARLLVQAELLNMHAVANNVVSGRFTAEWAAAAIQTGAWETYQVRLVRRLARNKATWGAISGLYASVDLLRVHPEAADVAALARSATAAQAGLEAIALRPLTTSAKRALLWWPDDARVRRLR